MATESLDNRVSRLESALEGGDGGYPSFLTVDSDGNIGADFAGHIHAKGLDLDLADTFNAPTDDRVRWLRPSDGYMGGAIWCYETGPGNGDAHMELQTYVQDATEKGSLIFDARHPNAGVHAVLGLECDPSGSDSVLGLALDGYSLVIADGQDRSDFVRLARSGGTKLSELNWGSITIAVGGGAPVSSSNTVNHGLGAIPKFAVANCLQSGAALINCEISTLTATQMNVTVRRVDGAGLGAGNYTCQWLAIT